jgi:tRNA (mo5U34)-methyltransferase
MLKRPQDFRWFHSIELGNGEVARGEAKSLVVIEEEVKVFYRHGVAGKSVLDIGAWDGAFSFAAERLGACDVLATDHFAWSSGRGWSSKAPFNYAHERLRSRVRSLDIDVPALTVEAVGGQFDTVLFAGVLYHVKDPLQCLENVAKLAREVLVVETVTASNDNPKPVMQFFLDGAMGGDASNYWAPNTVCLEHILRACGFKSIEVTISPVSPSLTPGLKVDYERHVVHALR